MRRFLAFTLATVVTSAPLSAQTATATLSADLGPVAKRSFSSTTLSFADADPDAVAQIPASGGPITITAKARAAQAQVVLTVLANGIPRSGGPYRVRVGRYRTRQAASGAATTLQKLRGEKFWVISEPPIQ